ncbi:MAG: serine/threonine-protein kinase [Candidatus Sumerlaeia bacterium]
MDPESDKNIPVGNEVSLDPARKNPPDAEASGHTIQNADRKAEDRTRLEPHSPTARTPFGPGNQPPTGEALPQSLQERYKLIRILGKGGFATVYLAEDSVLEQQVAIKVLKLGMTNKADQDRFLREARIGARLRHPNIAQVFDIIVAPDGLQMIMEYCPGGTLGELIKAKGALKPARAIQIARQAGQALAHAHQHQFIHRDIKPANIFFMNDGTVKLGDFGIAANVTSHEFTQTGMIIGTPVYMAPEQSSDSRDVDPRADIYSLGLTLYVMLTGHSPRVIDLDLVPPAFRSLIKHATQPDRNQRMVSAEQFCAMLDRIERQMREKKNGEGAAASATAATQTAAPEAVNPPSVEGAPSTASTMTASQAAPGPAWGTMKSVALGGAIAVIIVLLSVITVMLVKQNREIASQQKLEAALAARPTPTVAPVGTDRPFGQGGRGGRPGSEGRIPPRQRERMLQEGMTPGPRATEALPPRKQKRIEEMKAAEAQRQAQATPIASATRGAQATASPAATEQPAATAAPVNPTLADGMKQLLGSNRDVAIAFQNFRDYDKLDPLARRLTIARSQEAIEIARDQAIRSSQNNAPLLHLLAGYGLFRQGRLQPARMQIDQAFVANNRLVRSYRLDDQAEIMRLFGLDVREYQVLFLER